MCSRYYILYTAIVLMKRESHRIEVVLLQITSEEMHNVAAFKHWESGNFAYLPARLPTYILRVFRAK